MSNLLPKTTRDFTDPNYWKNFFEKRNTPFEWYGDYSNLSSVLEKYLKVNDNILQIGCGNSKLASEMYDSGYRNIHSIDIDSGVINEQRRMNKERHELSFDICDASKLASGDETMSVVVDKGTLDALLPPDTSKELANVVVKMFSEVHRVLKAGGRYLVITLAQKHLIKFWLDFFGKTQQYHLRVHEVHTSSNGFAWPVFVMIATKLKIPMPALLKYELWPVNHKTVVKADEIKDFLKMIAAEQELSRFIHMCSSKLESEVTITIHGADGVHKRFHIHILDDQDASELKTFGVFIVPLGRDGDWIFSTEKGRRALRAQIGKDRIIVVIMYRDQPYISLESVKDEISPLVSRFDPCPGLGLGFDIMSMGNVDVRRVMASGTSKLNGPWTVEDVTVGEADCRRLIFTSSSNIVQSEAMTKSLKNKKRQIDLDRLSCDHHNLMLSSLAMSRKAPLKNILGTTVKIAVLGLGGGLLATFLLRRFPKCRLTGVELDPDVVKIAKDFFGFPTNDARVDVRVMDAIEYLSEIAAGPEENKLDFLLVDVAGSMHENGLSCPPAVFLEDKALNDMRNCLVDGGILSLNLVTRDDEVASHARIAVKNVFPNLYTICCDNDVNEVLLGIKETISPDNQLIPCLIADGLPEDYPWMTPIKDTVGRVKFVD